MAMYVDVNLLCKKLPLNIYLPGSIPVIRILFKCPKMLLAEFYHICIVPLRIGIMQDGVTTCSQPLCMDVPHLRTDLSHAHGPFQRSVIECTATDHVISHDVYILVFTGTYFP